MLLRSISIALTFALSTAAPAAHAAPAETGPAYGPRLEGFDYPARKHEQQRSEPRHAPVVVQRKISVEVAEARQ